MLYVNHYSVKILYYTIFVAKASVLYISEFIFFFTETIFQMSIKLTAVKDILLFFLNENLVHIPVLIEKSNLWSFGHVIVS